MSLYSITTFIGKDVIFHGLKQMTFGIHTLVSYITTQHNHPIVEQQLQALDIVSCVATIEAVVEEIQDNVKEKRSHHLALNYVHETISSIHKELQALEKEMKYHDTRWFAAWREPNTKDSLLGLHLLKIQLEKRMSLFIQVMQIGI